MNLSSTATLFITLFLLAAVPAPSVYIVIAKASSSGLKSAVLFIAGLVSGDLLFIVLALYGLSAVASSYQTIFTLINYMGAIYLCWLGYRIWCKANNPPQNTQRQPPATWSSWVTGLLVTLSDPRAIIFYISLLPAHINVTLLSVAEVIMIMVIAILSVGGAKLLYAFSAIRLKSLSLNTRYQKVIDYLAAIMMTGSGIYLMLR